MTMNDATRAQIDAADPFASTWLSANAGSGKTRVLTDRVARLLLAGTNPQNILCLTYTKAAASEMQNRLFRRLGEWAMMPEPALRDQLRDMGIEGPANSDFLGTARKLFAAAIETPGGLKIQTIHSFCAGILRRFPLEAAVSPQFREMEDHETNLLREEVLELMSEGDERALVDRLATHYTGAEIGKFLSEITGKSAAFLDPQTALDARSFLSVDPAMTEADIVARTLTKSDGDLIRRARIIAYESGGNDAKAAVKLEAIDTSTPLTLRDLKTLENTLLFGESAKNAYGAKIGSFPKVATRDLHPEIVEELDDLMARVEEGRDLRTRFLALQKTEAVFAFADVFLRTYENLKTQRGVMDFDDLIGKTRQLLSDPLVAQWVLFRLDGGVDHILVDEAQDTSPAQWDVIRLLAQEFTTGEGAHAERERTIFVVGDKKQSIYSFQGADPEGFDRMRDHFGGALSNVGTTLHERELIYSFRSSDAILKLVDNVFSEPRREGLGGSIAHMAFHGEMPGRVDVWPVIEPEKEERPEWDDPLDQKGQMHHSIQLARQIAAEIRRMVDHETLPVQIDGAWVRRPITPGDILILVRRRNALFSEIISACKKLDLDVAGADRMKLGQEIAVKDILSLLSFLALPEDDLSLASALKSPLFGWDEKLLFDLSHPRPKGQSLWEALRKSETIPPRTMEILSDLRRQTDFLRPYDLINRILIRHGGRQALLSRLGPEAEDGIDALLSQALGFELSQTPSLTGFLSWLEREEIEIKRQMDTAGDRIRVMTVHGAKGLEAPIVILPDTTKPTRTIRGELLGSDDGVFWKPKKEDLPRGLADIQEEMLWAGDKELRRLLYVALTRAESWLIVAAAGDIGKPEVESWYNMVSDALPHVGAQTISAPFGEIERFSTWDWDAAPLIPQPQKQKINISGWGFEEELPEVPEKAETVSPSNLGGAKALAGDVGHLDQEAALAHGRVLHHLLEVLPASEGSGRADLAKRLVDSHPDRAMIPDPKHLISEAIEMLEAPDLAEIFAKGLPEVEITASLPSLDGKTILGAIDRLLVTDTDILAIDFKSNRIVPESAETVPVGLLRQMAAYRDALKQIYPDRTIKTALLWTNTRKLMALSDEALTHSLESLRSP